MNAESALWHPLAGVRAKLKRAYLHLEELQSLIEPALERSPCSLVPSWDPTQENFVGRLAVESEPPAMLGVVAGEAIQQLRSSLDHLAFQLALLRKPRPQGTSFPIFVSRDDWGKRRARDQPSPRERCERWFRPEHFDLVERKQPFNLSVPSSHGLAILARLSNEDKHEVLHTPYHLPRKLTIEGDQGAHVEFLGHGLPQGPIRDGDEIARWVLVPDDERLVGTRATMKWSIEIGLGFGNEGVRLPLLIDLARGVTRIVDEFEATVPAWRGSA